jgi:hypothetical protein
MGVFVAWPISPDLTSFVPRVMATLETSMWRRYYEKHYILLFYNLFMASRHVNFSPVASVNIAVKAASAAYLFQISRRSEAQQALRRYFLAISAGAPSPYSATDCRHRGFRRYRSASQPSGSGTIQHPRGSDRGLRCRSVAHPWYRRRAGPKSVVRKNVDFNAVFRGSRRGTENPFLSANFPIEKRSPAK